MHKNARSDMTGLSILRYFVSSSCGAARPCASVVPGWESSAIARGGGRRQSEFHHKMHKIAQQHTPLGELQTES